MLAGRMRPWRLLPPLPLLRRLMLHDEVTEVIPSYDDGDQLCGRAVGQKLVAQLAREYALAARTPP